MAKATRTGSLLRFEYIDEDILLVRSTRMAASSYKPHRLDASNLSHDLNELQLNECWYYMRYDSTLRSVCAVLLSSVTSQGINFMNVKGTAHLKPTVAFADVIDRYYRKVVSAALPWLLAAGVVPISYDVVSVDPVTELSMVVPLVPDHEDVKIRVHNQCAGDREDRQHKRLRHEHDDKKPIASIGLKSFTALPRDEAPRNVVYSHFLNVKNKQAEHEKDDQDDESQLVVLDGFVSSESPLSNGTLVSTVATTVVNQLRTIYKLETWREWAENNRCCPPMVLEDVPPRDANEAYERERNRELRDQSMGSDKAITQGAEVVEATPPVVKPEGILPVTSRDMSREFGMSKLELPTGKRLVRQVESQTPGDLMQEILGKRMQVCASLGVPSCIVGVDRVTTASNTSKGSALDDNTMRLFQITCTRLMRDLEHILTSCITNCMMKTIAEAQDKDKMENMLSCFFEGSFKCSGDESKPRKKDGKKKDGEKDDEDDEDDEKPDIVILPFIQQLRAKLSIMPLIDTQTALQLLEVQAISPDDFKKCTVHSLGLDV